MIRLDKYLSLMQVGTRTQIKALCKSGRVTVDGKIIKNSDEKIDENNVDVRVDGMLIRYSEYEYYMLNKPQKVICASTDEKQTTVIDLIKEPKRKDLFCVGRLDKDTEGLLLITNDGELSHRLLSPKKHVNKTYFAKLDKAVDDKLIAEFKKGIDINIAKCEDEDIDTVEPEIYHTLPAELVLADNKADEIYITICEGKFHQIKRMFLAFGIKVLFLKRVSFGKLVLDDTLGIGDYRKLSEIEIKLLKEGNNE